MDIRLLQLTIRNFKGCENLTLDFGGSSSGTDLWVGVTGRTC